MELTPEQLQKAESMSLDELRNLALQEAEEAVEAPVTPPAKGPQPRDEKGKFTSVDADELDNSGDPVEVEEEDGQPSKTIFRKEIENGDGSVDVYEADSLEDLVDKIAEGKRNANKKIQEFIAERKAKDATTQQVSQDEEYVIQQRLKDSPKKTIKEVVSEVIEERMAATARAEAAQSNFVNSHPDYVPNPDNGKRIASEVQRLGYSEFTSEGLEKAYQSLKKSGLLILKTEGADGATEAEGKDTRQTDESKPEPTQQRSSKKASTISSRSRLSVVSRNTQPTLDEAYSMPLEKLRELADKQLAGNRE